MILPALPPARDLLGERGYDSNWFRAGLIKRCIAPCITSTRCRRISVAHDKELYQQRHRLDFTHCWHESSA